MDQEKIEKHLKENLFAQHLNVDILEKNHDYAKVQMHSQDFHTNPNGQIHGGALFTLADVAAGTAAAGDNYKITTVNASINYLSPGKPGDILTAYAKVLKSGRTIAVIDVDIYNQDERLLCHSTFTFFKLHPQTNDDQ